MSGAQASSSRRPHLRVRSTQHVRSGPLLRAPLAGTPARAHQRLPGLPGAPRRSATQAGRLLPHGTPGNAHRALPGQLGALRRVHGGLKDGSWSARRTQRAPLAAAGAGRDWAGSSTTTRGRRAGGVSRTRWLDPRLGRETVDPPGHVGIMGAVGHEPRPRAPAASRPSHSRPGGRVPRPCRLATRQEGRVARIVDDTGLIAIGVDRSVWLDARGEDDPGQRAWVHGPVRRPVEPFRPVLPVADAGLGQRAARPPAARAGGGAVAVVVVVVHVPVGPHGGAGAPADLALRICALGRHSWLPTHRRPFASAHSAQPTRHRERQMRGFKSIAHLQRFASVHGVVQNLFRVGRHLLRAAHHRTLRTRAFAEWNVVTCAS